MLFRARLLILKLMKIKIVNLMCKWVNVITVFSESKNTVDFILQVVLFKLSLQLICIVSKVLSSNKPNFKKLFTSWQDISKTITTKNVKHLKIESTETPKEIIKSKFNWNLMCTMKHDKREIIFQSSFSLDIIYQILNDDNIVCEDKFLCFFKCNFINIANTRYKL